jgi:hypothetical protein
VEYHGQDALVDIRKGVAHEFAACRAHESLTMAKSKTWITSVDNMQHTLSHSTDQELEEKDEKKKKKCTENGR